MQQRQASAASGSTSPVPGPAEEAFRAQVPLEEEEAQELKCEREHDGLGEARGEDPKGPPSPTGGMDDEATMKQLFNHYNNDRSAICWDHYNEVFPKTCFSVLRRIRSPMYASIHSCYCDHSSL